MWWEEVESEGEVGGWEDGEALDEDIGDGLVFGKVRVELVSAAQDSKLASYLFCMLWKN